MSDGPYRSLPMRHACKRLAKRAHKSAFDSQDVADAVCPALAAHWAAEISKELMSGLWALCDTRQLSFIDDGRVAKIDALRRVAAGQGILGPVLVDCVEQALAQGKLGKAALQDAAHEALLDRTARDVSTIEEHYLRESTARKAAHVRARMLEGISLAPVKALADQLINSGAPVNRAPTKHDGLDDGVRL
jgi:hypothetical protein